MFMDIRDHVDVSMMLWMMNARVSTALPTRRKYSQSCCVPTFTVSESPLGVHLLPQRVNFSCQVQAMRVYFITFPEALAVAAYPRLTIKS